jgi:hypothetical protein
MDQKMHVVEGGRVHKWKEGPALGTVGRELLTAEGQGPRFHLASGGWRHGGCGGPGERWAHGFLIYYHSLCIRATLKANLGVGTNSPNFKQ